MSNKYVPIYVITGVFGAIFAFGPLIVPLFMAKGSNRQLTRVCIMMSAFCIWIFWVTAYISQMNPLAGPRLHKSTLVWYQYAFGDTVIKPTDQSRIRTDINGEGGIAEGEGVGDLEEVITGQPDDVIDDTTSEKPEASEPPEAPKPSEAIVELVRRAGLSKQKIKPK